MAPTFTNPHTGITVDTDDPGQVAYYRRRGWDETENEVISQEPAEPAATQPGPVSQRFDRPADDASAKDLRDFAESHGVDLSGLPGNASKTSIRDAINARLAVTEMVNNFAALLSGDEPDPVLDDLNVDVDWVMLADSYKFSGDPLEGASHADMVIGLLDHLARVEDETSRHQAILTIFGVAVGDYDSPDDALTAVREHLSTLVGQE